MIPVPIPIATPARRTPANPGIIAHARPTAVSVNPAATPTGPEILPASKARPACGWVIAAHNASTETAAPVATGPRPAAAPETGRNPTPTDNADVAAASAAVGRRNRRSLNRRARSTTVCRDRGSGGSPGTTVCAQIATTRRGRPSRQTTSRGRRPTSPHHQVAARGYSRDFCRTRRFRMRCRAVLSVSAGRPANWQRVRMPMLRRLAEASEPQPVRVGDEDEQH
ncbi:hypothetical protein EN35_02080 [Rhodococcus qingshengii]|nr:hypothetical protein EN35_02080 [Rhodococcus qingshengii]